MIRLLIADDERMEREALADIVMRRFEHEVTVEMAENGRKAADTAVLWEADLILMDIEMPGMNGLEMCKKIRETNNIPIIMLSAKSTDLDKILGLGTGADDYVVKPFNPLELLARVKSMMRRYTSLGSIAEKNNVIRIGDVELDKDAKEVRVNGKLVKMTATEYGILQLLMENAGKVFSIDEIYERVWNESSFSPENTVSVHIRRIREKIEINPKEPRYLKVVWGIGYKIEKI